MTRKNFEEYLQTAGDWEIDPTVSRSQSGRLNEVSRFVQYAIDNGVFDSKTLSRKATELLRDSGTKRSSFDTDIPKIMDESNFVWHEPVSTTVEIDFNHLQEVNQKLTDLEKSPLPDDDDELTDEYFKKLDQRNADFQKLNNELIKDFLKSSESQYSSKTVKNYKNMLELYLNEFLAYRSISCFNPESSSIGELFIHGSTITEVKNVQKAMGKFYQFFNEANLLDLEFVKQMKNDMKLDVQCMTTWF